MKIRLLLVAVFAILGFVACAPTDRPSLRPTLFSISEPAKIGETVTIQGRNLGSAVNSSVIFGANDVGQGGTRATSDNVVSWAPSLIQVKIPQGAKVGGNFVFVSVAGVLSNGLPYSVGQ